jgi:hypothetical protein
MNVMYKSAQEMAGLCVVEDGDTVEAIVDGRFIFGDFIHAWIISTGKVVEELTISVLSLGAENVDAFAALMEAGWIKKLNIIVSGMFFAHEEKGLVKYMYMHLDKPNGPKFTLACGYVHTKIVNVLFKAGQKVCICGSANLRSSDNVEQFTIRAEAGIYDFHQEWMGTVLEKYGTIDHNHPKPIRKEFWEGIGARSEKPRLNTPKKES